MCSKPKVWLLKNFLIFFSSSGQVIPPIDYNGFKATVEFISRAKGGGRLSSSGNEDDVDEDDDGGQSSKKQNKGRKNRGRKGGE